MGISCDTYSSQTLRALECTDTHEATIDCPIDLTSFEPVIDANLVRVIIRDCVTGHDIPSETSSKVLRQCSPLAAIFRDIQNRIYQLEIVHTYICTLSRQIGINPLKLFLVYFLAYS